MTGMSRCLFRTNAGVKSSAAVLNALPDAAALKGEGDFGRHLAMLGFTVSHVQTALDERECRVTNLAEELRDGVVLARAVDTLSNGTHTPL